jgi:hypothetical protein
MPIDHTRADVALVGQARAIAIQAAAALVGLEEILLVLRMAVVPAALADVEHDVGVRVRVVVTDGDLVGCCRLRPMSAAVPLRRHLADPKAGRTGQEPQHAAAVETASQRLDQAVKSLLIHLGLLLDHRPTGPGAVPARTPSRSDQARQVRPAGAASGKPTSARGIAV